MGIWDTTKKVGGAIVDHVNPFQFSPVNTLVGGAKLGYHAFTDPTDTPEQRAVHEMHMDDDITQMIPIYGNVMGTIEEAETAKAYFDRWMRGKSDQEAPLPEERKLAWYKSTQWQRDAAAAEEEQRWSHPGEAEAHDEQRLLEQHKDAANVEYTADGTPYTPVAPVSGGGE